MATLIKKFKKKFNEEFLKLSLGKWESETLFCDLIIN